MEERDVYRVLFRDIVQFLLRTLQVPGRREEAAILGAVGGPDHYDLSIALRANPLTVDGVFERSRQDTWSIPQICDRFEQRNNRQSQLGIARVAAIGSF